MDIYPDVSGVTKDAAYWNDIIQAGVNFFNKALTRRWILTSIPITKAGDYQSVCPSKELSTSPAAQSANMYYFFETYTFKNDNGRKPTMETHECLRTTGKGQPYIVYTRISDTLQPPSTSLSASEQVQKREMHIYTMLHEMLHAFGISYKNFQFFWDNSNNRRYQQNEVYISELWNDGAYRRVLILDDVKTWMKDYFGCDELSGLPLEENTGPGAHFDKRFFPWDIMSSPALNGQMRFSELAAVILKASGWYWFNNAYIEPTGFGKNAGCSFFTESPANLASSFPNEYCPTPGDNKIYAGYYGRGYGYCENTKDNLNEIPIIFPVVSSDCWDTTGSSNNPYTTRATYSYAFPTDFTTHKFSCLEYSCLSSNTQVRIEIPYSQGQFVICSAEGWKDVVGGGRVQCPDPESFCENEGKKFCPRNCMGKGTCVSSTRKCSCNAGWTGYDCSQRSDATTIYGGSLYGL